MNVASRLDQALTGIYALVGELIERPLPIDYARRRWVFRDLDLVPGPGFVEPSTPWA